MMQNSIVFLLVGIAAVLAGPIIPAIRGPGLLRITDENIDLIASGDHKQNIEELSGQFEGDIVLNENQYDYIFGSQMNRNGLINVTFRWPNNTVPYLLDYLNHTQEQRDHIEKGLRFIESVTCLKFVRRTNQEDYIQVQGSSPGCWSMVGRQGGVQQLNLQPFAVDTGCFRLGTVIHEFTHALGFFHMQSSSERDQHVNIEWDHMIPHTANNFRKYNASVVTNYEHGYDYDSIMHYSAYAFTKDGYATIVPNNITYLNVIGQRGSMSPLDIAKLNTMYNCPEASKP